MRWTVLAVVFACLMATQAQAATPKKHQQLWFGQIAGRLAPLGLLARGAYGYRRRLFNRDSLLLKDANFAALGLLAIAPTYTFVGARLRIDPLAIVRLRADYEIGGHFGLLSSLRSFDSSLGDLSAQERFDTIDQSPKQAVLMQRITLGARLQAKIKRIAARYEAIARRHLVSVPKDKVAWFNPTLDLLAPTQGWTLHQDADLLFEIKPGLFLAARYSQTSAYHEDRDKPVMIQRLGPAAVWRRPKPSRSRIDAGSWFALVQWNLSHPFRDGTILPVAMPMMILGWGLEGH